MFWIIWHRMSGSTVPDLELIFLSNVTVADMHDWDRPYGKHVIGFSLKLKLGVVTQRT